MTTLTPNRILQQGDEYRNNGTWKAVPKEDYGLQVMFTKYAEVRRPSESEPLGANPDYIKFGLPAISPDSKKPEAVKPSAKVTAKAEKGKTPAPTPSGAGELPPPHWPDFTGEFEKALKKAGLPTVVSVKAHQDAIEHPEFVGHVPPEIAHAENIVVTPKGEIEKAHEALIKITFPKPDPTDLIAMSTQPIWTGRNGTFTGYGLEAMITNDNVMLSPIGKRGIGNCCIQFPQSVIPQLVDWLLRQQTTAPK